MIIFVEENIPYFVYKDRRDAIEDYASFCSEMYTCEDEHSAIRKHLLLNLGIMED